MPARRALSAVVLLAVAAMSLLLSLLLTPPAFADGLPPMHLSKTTVTLNEPFTVSGSGCFNADAAIGELPSVLVLGPNAVVVHANSAGTWSATLTFTVMPRGGDFGIKVVCSSGAAAGVVNQTYPAPPRITVVGGPGAPPTTVAAPRTHAPTAAVTPAPPSVTSAPPLSATPTAPPSGPAAGCIACTRIASGSPLGAGWPVSLRYTGFQPDEQVTLLMHSTPVRLGIFTADESGVVTASVRIPDDATAGSHTLTFTGPVTGDRVVPFSVTAAAPVAPAPPAPARSATPTALAAAGAVVVLVLVVGGAVVYRRRQAGPLRGR